MSWGAFRQKVASGSFGECLCAPQRGVSPHELGSSARPARRRIRPRTPPAQDHPHARVYAGVLAVSNTLASTCDTGPGLVSSSLRCRCPHAVPVQWRPGVRPCSSAGQSGGFLNRVSGRSSRPRATRIRGWEASHPHVVVVWRRAAATPPVSCTMTRPVSTHSPSVSAALASLSQGPAAPPHLPWLFRMLSAVPGQSTGEASEESGAPGSVTLHTLYLHAHTCSLLRTHSHT